MLESALARDEVSTACDDELEIDIVGQKVRGGSLI
jgi:hypothetical protein